MILKNLFFSFFCLIFNSQRSVQASEPEYILACDEFPTLDFTRFESQLEELKTGNELLKVQMDKQDVFLQRLEEKIEMTTQGIETKILAQNKEYYGLLIDSIEKQNQLIQTQVQEAIANEKSQMVSHIEEMIKDRDISLGALNEKLNNMESVWNKLNLETQQLGKSISENLTILENIDAKLTDIKSITATKSDQRELDQLIKTHFTENDANKQFVIAKGKELVCITSPYPTSCADFNANYCENNKCRIFNQIHGPKPFLVSCDNQAEDGGWTVIQRRINGSVDFYRDWSEYKAGFGDIAGEFFIGLDKLHALTTALQPMELLIQLQYFNDTSTYAKYDEFILADELENYKLLKVGIYSGNATDSFSQHQGFMFSTKDRDNDGYADYNCAKGFEGAWWFSKCFYSNLNGKYYKKEEPANKGICWNTVGGCKNSLKFVQMMIRPKKI